MASDHELAYLLYKEAAPVGSEVSVVEARICLQVLGYFWAIHRLQKNEP